MPQAQFFRLQYMPPGSTFLRTTTLALRSLYILPSFIKLHLAFSDFLAATPMALLRSSEQTTSSESIINDLPTPPLTANAKIPGRIAAILRVLKAYKNGCPPLAPWTV